MKRALWIVSLLPLVITAVVLQFFPEGVKVPMHYDAAGNINRWGSKYENFIFPFIILLIALFWTLMLRYYEKKRENAKDDKERAEAESNAKVLGLVAVLSALLWTGLQCVFLYGAYTAATAGAAKATVNFNKFQGIFLGLLLIIAANFMTKTRINGAVGVRTTWSMYNENTWRKSNRFGAIALIITGVLILIGSACIDSSVGAIVLPLVLIGIAAAIIIAYSYHVYNEEKKAEAAAKGGEDR